MNCLHKLVQCSSLSSHRARKLMEEGLYNHKVASFPGFTPQLDLVCSSMVETFPLQERYISWGVKSWEQGYGQSKNVDL